jgi:hypothetical protein
LLLALGKKNHKTLSEKITKAKKSWGVAQEVKHLPIKLEALNSTPVPQKKKRGETRWLGHEGSVLRN